MQRTIRSIACLCFVLLGWYTVHATVVRLPPLYTATDMVIQTPYGGIKLKANTPVVVETIQNLSSKNLSVGQNVAVRVKFQVQAEKKTLINPGAPGTAVVTSVKKAKGFGKAGSLELQVTNVQAVDSQQVPISGLPLEIEGDSRVGLAIGIAVAGALLLFLIGGIAGLLIKGSDAEVKAGSSINGSVATEIEVDPKG